MLNLRHTIVHFAVAVALVLTSCTSEAAAPSPITVDPATAAGAAGVMTVKVGAIVNTDAPTAERDERLVEVLMEATTTAATGAAVQIEVMRIDEVADAESAVASLAGLGVTVIAALCDDASVPPIVDAAVASGMLAITACVTLPTPTLTSSSPMFIDLAGMHDSPAALASWVDELGADNVATFRSDLIGDVDATCLEAETALVDLGVALDASVTFTELVDDPATVVSTASPLLAEVDVIVLCALPPTAGDVVTALRLAGHDQPVVVPWFADGQVWPATIDGVSVIAAASRYGDDPEERVTKLLDELGPTAEAVDVVAADSISMLSLAAERAGSVGATRLADAMRRETTAVVSGTLSLVGRGAQTEGRSYRAIAITGGEARFDSIVTAALS